LFDIATRYAVTAQQFERSATLLRSTRPCDHLPGRFLLCRLWWYTGGLENNTQGERAVDCCQREKIRMFRLIGAAAFVGMALTALPASAQPYDSYDYPYCLQGRDYGLPGLCEFTSYAQCQATASGTFSYCGENPRFAFAAPRYGQPLQSYARMHHRQGRRHHHAR
jgi:Protein of unknown function (DUF3551)